jgi:hypothetical protein
LIRRYRRRPAVVEAVQWSPEGRDPWALLRATFDLKEMPGRLVNGVVAVFQEGTVVLCAPGNWLLRYEDGSIESCAHEQFERMYEFCDVAPAPSKPPLKPRKKAPKPKK